MRMLGRASSAVSLPPRLPPALLVNRHLVIAPAYRPTDNHPELSADTSPRHRFLEMARQRAWNFVAGRESNMAAATNETTGTPRSLPPSLFLAWRLVRHRCGKRPPSGRRSRRRSREREKETERAGEFAARVPMKRPSRRARRFPRSDSVTRDFAAGARNARRDHRRRESRAASRPDYVGRHGYGVHTGRVATHVARSAAVAAAAKRDPGATRPSPGERRPDGADSPSECCKRPGKSGSRRVQQLPFTTLSLNALARLAETAILPGARAPASAAAQRDHLNRSFILVPGDDRVSAEKSI